MRRNVRRLVSQLLVASMVISQSFVATADDTILAVEHTEESLDDTVEQSATDTGLIQEISGSDTMVTPDELPEDSALPEDSDLDSGMMVNPEESLEVPGEDFDSGMNVMPDDILEVPDEDLDRGMLLDPDQELEWDIATPSNATRSTFDLSKHRDRSIIAELDVESGLLMITGTGDIRNYKRSPFEDDSDCIHEIYIGEGITSIGNNTFRGLTEVTDVHISDNIFSIGKKAFYECTSLTEIYIPGDIRYIGDKAFAECCSLETILDSSHNYPIPATPSNATPSNATPSNAEYVSYAGEDVFSGTAIASLDITNFTNADKEFLQGMESLEEVIYAGNADLCMNFNLPNLNTIIWTGPIEGSSMTSEYMNADSVVYCYPDSDVLEWCVENNQPYALIGKSFTWRINTNGGILLDTPAGYVSDTEGYVLSKSGNYYGATVASGGTFNGRDGLPNVNNPEHINMSNPGYHVPDGMEWYIVVEGNYRYFDMDTAYTADEILDPGEYETGDIVVFYANWVEDTQWDVSEANDGSVVAEYDAGKLTITGQGAMRNFTEAPYAHLRKDVTSVVVEPGITSVGSNAFKDFAVLECISVPASVEYVGRDAFLNIPVPIDTYGTSYVHNWCKENAQHYRLVDATYNVTVTESLTFTDTISSSSSTASISVINSSNYNALEVKDIQNTDAGTWKQVEISNNAYWAALPLNTREYGITFKDTDLYNTKVSDIITINPATEELLDFTIYSGGNTKDIVDESISNVVITMGFVMDNYQVR